MSVKLMGAIFDLAIPAAEKLVLLAMADHARDDGTGCYPAIATLAKKTSLSRRGVQKLIRRLQAAHLIADAGKVSRLGTVEYTITLEKGGEQGSLPFSLEGRTRRRKGANQKTQRGELGSPESLRTKNITGNRSGGGCQDPSSSGLTFITTTAAFDALDLGEPYGWKSFQAAVVKRAPERQNGNLLDVLERIAQDCDSKCPKKFFDSKHELERALAHPQAQSGPKLPEPLCMADPELAEDINSAIDEAQRTHRDANLILKERRAARAAASA